MATRLGLSSAMMDAIAAEESGSLKEDVGNGSNEEEVAMAEGGSSSLPGHTRPPTTVEAIEQQRRIIDLINNTLNSSDSDGY